MTFRGRTTTPISSSASTSTLKSALEALEGIKTDSLLVTLSSGTTVCADLGASPNAIQVEFTQNFGE